jgi:hypothetical protein
MKERLEDIKVMSEKFAVHPGHITSDTDSDIHHISATELVNLYQLSPGSYIIWDRERPETYEGRIYAEYIHLYPKRNGNYKKPSNYVQIFE